MDSNVCIFHIILASLLLTLVSCQNGADNGSGQQCSNDFRLPRNILPIYNTVVIYTDLNEDVLSYWGYSEIQIKVYEETDTIILHSRNLTIQESDVTVITCDDNNASQNLKVSKIDYNTDYDFLIITVGETLSVDSIYEVSIPFKAPLSDSCSGYLKYSYEDSMGNVIWYAATDLYDGMARDVFPVFDEPGMPTIFSISLAHTTDFIAISTMDIYETSNIDDMDGWVMDKFNDTPTMSSAWLGIFVGQFGSYAIPDTDVQVNIWCRKDILNQLSVVQNTVQTIFPYFDQQLGIQYSEYLSKLDIMVLPSYGDIQTYLGVIIADESAYMYNDEKDDTIYTPYFISLNVSEFLAEQWFGGLMSIIWWNEVAINYGLSYMYNVKGISFLMGNDVYEDIAVHQAYNTVMRSDSKVDNDMVLLADIQDPENLIQNNTPELNKKAFLFIRMLTMVVGRDALQNGITNYIEDNQIAVVEVLLQEIQDAGEDSGTINGNIGDFNDLFANDLYKEGFALVTVEVDVENQVLYISQLRFINDASIDANTKSQLEQDCFSLPLSWVTSQDLNFDNYMVQNWLKCGDILRITLENFTENDFILFNVQMYGRYLVKYSSDNWYNIGKYLLDENQFSNIHPLNRVQLMFDSLAIAWVGYMQYDIPFYLLPYLKYETEEAPINQAFLGLQDILNRLLRTESLDSFYAFVDTFLGPLFERYNDATLVPDDIIEARVKSVIDFNSCTFNNQAYLEQSYNALLQWSQSSNPDTDNMLPITIRDSLYCAAIKQGDENLWNFMFERQLSTNCDSDEQIRILNALGCSRDPAVLSKYLQLSLDPNTFSPDLFPTIFNSIVWFQQTIGFPLAFDFLINNYQQIVEILDDVTLLCPVIANFGYYIETQDELDQFNQFIQTAQIEDSCACEIDLATKAAINNIAWHDYHDTEMYDLLQNIITNN